MKKEHKLTNFVDLLRYRAKSEPDKVAYTFLLDGEDKKLSITYAELNMRAQSIARELRKSCVAGDRALLLFPSCLDFIYAFFGCLFAGIVAVPAYPPVKNRKLDRLLNIVEDCEARMVLTVAKTYELIYDGFSKNSRLQGGKWMKVDEIRPQVSSKVESSTIAPEDLAFIQYTSGSTGDPKGVMVTHENLIENSRVNYESCRNSADTVKLSWLPLFHDMGLIDGVLQPLYGGFPAILMAPEAFVLKPSRWLRAISKYKVTNSGAPNFAYELCIEKVSDEELANLDLSSWKLAYSGAEPILAETLEAFAERFRAAGFDDRAFFPCYGMAEATLFISGPIPLEKTSVVEVDRERLKADRFEPLAPGSPLARKYVGCGRLLDDNRVLIVNPETKRTCLEGEVGEIWYSGKSAAKGYWKREELSREIFQAYTSDTQEGPFLRTGDLGILHNDELYITGRLKDLIIIRGKNHYPQDIENTLTKSDESLIMGSTAAFSIEKDGLEKLVLVQEVKRTSLRDIKGEEVVKAIRQAISREHALEVSAIVLLKPYSIPKTSSGKIQRKRCRQMYEAGELNSVFKWEEREEARSQSVNSSSADKAGLQTIEQLIMERVCFHTDTSPEDIDLEESFSSYNLDSVKAVMIAGELNEHFDADFPHSLAYDYPSIKELAAFIWNELDIEADEEPEKRALCPAEEGQEPIAVIGMECLLPGAKNTEEFWEILSKGRDMIGEIPESRWRWEEYYSPQLVKGKMNSKWGGFVEEIDRFDAAFFQITPKEALSMDPQQRLLLEQIYRAIENAGYASQTLGGSQTGVFIGIGNNEYGSLVSKNESLLNAYLGTGNSLSISANRVSYYFNFKGPSLSIDTACSSSLTAVHLACRSINSGECDLAIAGAVNLILEPSLTVALSQAEMLSPDGKCKTFDSTANGYVRSEGCGVLVLKKLSQAKADGDNILALIEGSAIGQDGKSNGLTAPNGVAQERVIKKALHSGGIRAGEVQFVETHGSATKLGDPIEIEALNRVYGKGRTKDNPLLIGSVKANIGHLEACAGMAGLIKTILCLKHKKIPPQINIRELNSHLNWDKMALKVPFKLTDWIAREGGLRRAGVSSFGFGGSNAHLLLSEVEPNYDEIREERQEIYVLPISAQCPQSMLNNLKNYLTYLEETDAAIGSICRTAIRNRNHFRLKRAVSGSSKSELIEQIALLITQEEGGELSASQDRETLKGESALASFIESYENGEEVNWDDIIPGTAYNKVTLPSYHFNKKSYWASISTPPLKSPIKSSIEDRVEPGVMDERGIKLEIKGLIGKISGLDLSEIDDDTELLSLGLDSIMLVRFRKEINERFNLDISFEQFFNQLVNIDAISGYILENSKGVRVALRSETIESRERPLVKKRRPRINFRSNRFEEDDLTEQQRLFLDSLVESYTTRTALSKETNSKIRKECAHWLSSINYRQSLKELIYPLIAEKEEGAYIYDVDGNRYIDIAMGYGVHFFGHRADFINEAIIEQLGKGYCLTPHTDNLLEVSRLFKEVTKTEKVTFCNTGSEAIMFALRIARTVTGRGKVVKFAGAYHGVYDGILAENVDDEIVPICPGITDGAVDDLEVLLYGAEESLERIRELKDDIAAVLVEPVQSRHPGFQPQQFLKRLRSLTEEIGAALIFDEIITGFRIGPGGAQEYFGIEADLVTYGKILGGGLPVGIVAGKTRYLDAVDGGDWNYSDSSSPAKETTFIAGTFANHPLLLASMKAVLRHIITNGEQIYGELNRKTADFAAEMNSYFAAENLPIVIKNFGSLFRFESTGRYDLALNPIEMDLFFYLLRMNGLYLWERKICFLSTAHSDADLEKIKDAVKSSLKQLREGGFRFKSGLPAATGQKIFSMSSAQKRLYSLERLEGGDLPYHMTNALLIKGYLNAERLKTILDRLTRRHESLRTSFFIDGKRFKQKVESSLAIEIVEKKIAKEDLEDEIRDFVKPFDLAKAPLMRAMLAQIEEEEQLLLFDINHIIFDGYSANILSQELMALFAGKELPPLKKQYADYVEWEESYLLSESFKSQREYWTAQFSKPFEPLELPTDYIRPLHKRYEGQTIYSNFDPKKTAKIKEYCRSQGVTVYNFLLSAYYLLLSTLSGQEEIAVGTPVAVRDEGDFEAVVGMFTNTLVLPNHVGAHRRFIDFMHEVGKNLVNSLANKEYPYELLVKEVGAKKEANRNPLFDVMFVYENGSDRVYRIKDLEISRYNCDLRSAMFDLMFEVVAEHDCFNFNLNFDSQLFRYETIERWKEYYKKIVDDLIANPDLLIKEVEIITPREREQILLEWNDTKVDSPNDRTVITVFEEQVLKTPAAIAVVFNDLELTYKELNERANIVAHYLRDNYQVAPDDLVGVVMDRSEKLLITILGIFKAGCAYIPIDPAYPAERQHYIINDSEMKVVIGSSEALKIFDSTGKGSFIDIEDVLAAKGRPDNPPLLTTPRDLAYIIYTSGSTGKPKGAMVEHAGMLNHLYSKIDILKVDSKSRVVQNASQCFDISVWQMFVALLEGGTTYIYDNSLVLNPAQFIKRVVEDRISILEVVPTFLDMMLDELKAERALDCLDYLVVTGEELKKSLVERWFALYPGIEMVNAYGPTEASDDITHYVMDSVPEEKTIPIGKTVRNLTIYIVDRYGRLSPQGVPGELWVSGIGVGRGYINNREKTEAAFMADPFSKIPGVRLYRTGDLARWLPDGNIEFLGRLDNQVKIRGFRIELGEIESALAAFEEISSSVVVAWENERGDKELVAYLVALSELDPAVLRRYLEQNLPDYMIPAYFVQLEELPLTANGKIDRKSLPEPEAAMAVSIEYAPPTSEMELILARIWKEILRTEGEIGIDDNFFQLGGDSIKSIQIISALNRQGLKGDARALFRAPTIRELALLIKRDGLIIDQSAVSGELPLTPIQQRFFSEIDSPKHHYNQAIMIKVRDEINLEALKEVCRTLINHHDALRLSFRVSEQGVSQLNRGEQNLAFSHYDLRSDPSPERRLEQIIETMQSSFNLEHDSLIRFAHFKMKKGERLFLVAHHLIIDGISWRILLEDLESGYLQALQGERVTLPLKSSSYKEWSESLVEFARSEELEREGRFWQELESEPSGELPGQGLLSEPEKNSERLSLSLEESNLLLSGVNEAFNTHINDILITALARTLSIWSGEQRVRVDLESHGRSERFEHLDISRTVGWFTSIYPILPDLSGSEGLDSDIITVKEHLRQIPDNGVGYTVLKYLANGLESGGNRPGSQVLFNYLGQVESDGESDLFSLTTEATGSSVSPLARDGYRLTFEGIVIEGRFRMSLESEEYGRKVVSDLLSLYMEELRVIIEYLERKLSLADELDGERERAPESELEELYI